VAGRNVGEPYRCLGCRQRLVPRPEREGCDASVLLGKRTTDNPETEWKRAASS
jgi:hypothetical protein